MMRVEATKFLVSTTKFDSADKKKISNPNQNFSSADQIAVWLSQPSQKVGSAYKISMSVRTFFKRKNSTDADIFWLSERSLNRSLNVTLILTEGTRNGLYYMWDKHKKFLLKKFVTNIQIVFVF